MTSPSLRPRYKFRQQQTRGLYCSIRSIDPQQYFILLYCIMINSVIRSPFNGDGSFSVPTFIILILHKFWLRCFYILNVITELNVSLAKGWKICPRRFKRWQALPSLQH